MTIQFNSIPVSFRVPGSYVEFDSSLANTSESSLPQAILLIGASFSSGLGTRNQVAQVASADEVAVLAGRGSMLHQMAKAVFAANSITPVYIIPQGAATGATKATRQVTLSGAATAAGSVVLYVGDRRYEVAVAAGDSSAAVAADIVAALQDDDDARYVDADVDSTNTSRIVLTARHAGVDCGRVAVTLNRFSGERVPPGLAVAIGALVDGTGNAAISTAITAMGDTWYPTIVMPYTDAPNLADLVKELSDRFGPIRQIEGYAYVGTAADQSTVTALAQSINSPHVSVVDCSDALSPPWVVVSAVAAMDALEPDPARPRQTLPLSSLLSKADVGRRTKPVRNQLLEAGVSTLVVDLSGVVRIERLTTSYRLNASGLPDDSYFDTEAMHVLANLRYTLRTRFANKYPRHKLGKDGTLGPNVITPSTARAELIALYRDWMERGWVEGGTAFEQFKSDLRVEIDAQDPNRLNAIVPPDLINQLRIFAAQIQFRR